MSFSRSNRITTKFNELKQARQKALIIYLTAGDPDLAVTERLVSLAAAAGADIIELGIPFSDPVADGPIIQAASQRALASGTTIERVLKMVARCRQQTDVPLVLMSYYNPILSYGLSRFAADGSAAGVDGVIVPDLPVEEQRPLAEAFASYPGLALIPLVAPTSTGERIAKIAEVAQGFIYCVSLTGVTGVRDQLNTEIGDFIKRIRDLTPKPVAVGFGVSNPDQAKFMARFGDGVIIGSAVVRLLAQYADKQDLLPVLDFIRSIKGALNEIDE